MRRMMIAALAAAALMGAGSSRAEIVVAAAGPMTGSYAAFGEQMRRGAEMAVADLNAKGGVLGQRLRLDVGDDACDPKQATAVANQLRAKGVKMVAGHYCSSSSIPASEVYAEENILQISPASTAPAFTDRKLPNVFRVCGRDDQQGAVAGNFLADNFKDEKIAIINDKTTYGKGLADETQKTLNARGIKEVMYESYNPGEKDYSALVSKLKQAGVEILFVGGYHTEAGLIKRQMVQQGMTTLLVAGDALMTSEYWAITGAAGEGTMMTFSPDPRKMPEAADAVAKFRKAGYEPEGYTLYTYAAMQVWAQAVAKANTTDTAAVSKALKNGRFKTVIGEIGFDAKGDVTAPGYVVYAWKDGKYDYFVR